MTSIARPDRPPYRSLLLLMLSALSACAAPPPPLAAPPPPPVAPPAPTPEQPLDLLPSLPPPDDGTRPVVRVDADHIRRDGKLLGSVPELESLGKLQKVDALFDDLKAVRETWKATHGDEPFLGTVSLVVHPDVSGRVFASAYQTVAFAGFPNIYVAVDGRYYETDAQVPGPPCGTADMPCPPSPRRRTLHAQIDAQRWRLRVPREEGPLDDSGEGPNGSVESFRAAVARAASTAGVGRVMFHVPHEVPFTRFSRYLAGLVELNRRLGLAEGVTVTIREIDGVKGTVEPTVPTARAEGPTTSGRIAPEHIQKVVRSKFGALRKCYEGALARDASATGRTETRFVIGTQGKTTEAHTTLSGNLPPAMGPCMEAVFKAMVFDAPAGGRVIVTYPIMFSPGE